MSPYVESPARLGIVGCVVSRNEDISSPCKLVTEILTGKSVHAASPAFTTVALISLHKLFPSESLTIMLAPSRTEMSPTATSRVIRSVPRKTISSMNQPA